MLLSITVADEPTAVLVFDNGAIERTIDALIATRTTCAQHLATNTSASR
jgi:hypothetical protein